ncbi:ENOB enolase, partial [Serilophus lunatus]|nr:ENOB enolase [Serilophus lunatus]
AKFGANAILGVSLAVCKAGAAEKGIPLYQHIANLAGNTELILPVPAFNVINGGSHAGNKLAMQEFMVLPVGAATFREAVRIGAEVYHSLKAVIKAKYGKDATNVGDEGGFAPNILENNEEGPRRHWEALQVTGMDWEGTGGTLGRSGRLWEGGWGLMARAGLCPRPPTRGDWALLGRTGGRFPAVVSIEDPFDQDDWEGWKHFLAQVDIQVVGDDLTVTNPKRIAKAAEVKACNCLLLKVNQIGSVTESIQA